MTAVEDEDTAINDEDDGDDGCDDDCGEEDDDEDDEEEEEDAFALRLLLMPSLQERSVSSIDCSRG